MFNVSSSLKNERIVKLIQDKSYKNSEKIRQIKQPYQEVLTKVGRGGRNGPPSGRIELTLSLRATPTYFRVVISLKQSRYFFEKIFNKLSNDI